MSFATDAAATDLDSRIFHLAILVTTTMIPGLSRHVYAAVTLVAVVAIVVDFDDIGCAAAIAVALEWRTLVEEVSVCCCYCCHCCCCCRCVWWLV